MLAHRLKKSKPAFVLLTISGLSLLLTSVAILVAGCLLLYHENFLGSDGLKDKIQIQFDYSHYWLGGIYLLTALLTLSSACRQNRRRMTFIAATFLTMAIALSLFAVVLDGPDWIEWKDVDRTLKFWESKDKYTCKSRNKTCSCGNNGQNSENITISTIANCDDVLYLVAIYGVIAGGAVIGFVICLASLLIMVNSFSWKNPWKAFTSYTASYENKLAISSMNNVMELYREQPTRQPTVVSSSSSSLARHNKEYMPAWSLYGSTADDINNPDPYANQR